jgi:hypothetical protein
MKAREITEAGKEALLSKKYKVVRINYANPDMVRLLSFLLRPFSRAFLVFSAALATGEMRERGRGNPPRAFTIFSTRSSKNLFF